MGWTYTYNAVREFKRGRYVVNRKAEMDRLYTTENRDANGNVEIRWTVLKSSMVGSVWYAAVRYEDMMEPAKSRIFGCVALTSSKNGDFGYKDMPESMEPYFYDCPASILALLSPTDNERANEWRRKCRERAVEKAAKRKATRDNGGVPPAPFVPAGVVYRWDSQHRWHVLTSREYVAANIYSGVRYSARSWKPEEAVAAFLRRYGTEGQRAEYSAKTGHSFTKVA